jgi:hypothetical protein
MTWGCGEQFKAHLASGCLSCHLLSAGPGRCDDDQTKTNDLQ